jgi:hypothetical protein
MSPRQKRSIKVALSIGFLGLLIALIGVAAVYTGYTSFGTTLVAIGVIGGNLCLITAVIIRFLLKEKEPPTVSPKQPWEK